MKTKLIQTEDYLLLIDEEAEIKQNELGWLGDNIIQPFRLRWQEKDWKKLLAYYPLTKEAKPLDLPLLPKFNKETFTLGDIKKAYRNGWADRNEISTEHPPYFHNDISHGENSLEKFIQSLSTQKLPKEFIPYLIFDKKGVTSPQIITNSEGKLELVGTYKY